MTAPITLTPGLPVVSREISIGPIREFRRAETDDDSKDYVLIGCIDRVRRENPEIVRSVLAFIEEGVVSDERSALIAMAVTYRVLSAQAEVDFLIPDGNRLMLNTGVHRGIWYFNLEEDATGGQSAYLNRPRSSAPLKEISRRANAHDALVAALKDLLQYGWWENAPASREKAEAALKLAGAE